MRFTLVPIPVLLTLGAAASAPAQCVEQKLARTTPLEYERFGATVALSADRAVAGAPWSPGLLGGGRFTRAGAVYPFRDTGAGWIADPPIHAPDARPGDNFGEDLAFGPGRLMVGANAGGAYLFRTPKTPGEEWVLEAKLADPGFGSQVAMMVGADAATRAVVAAPESGQAVIFRHDAGSWIEEARVTPDWAGGGWLDQFGSDIAAEDDTVIVGHTELFAPGAVHIIQRVDGCWEHVETLSESAHASLTYGVAVALRGGTLAVAESRTISDPLPGDPSGRVHIYRREAGAWLRETVLNEDGAIADYGFGSTLSFVGDMLAVKSEVFIRIYQRDAGAWRFVHTIYPPAGFGLVSVAGDDDPTRLIAGDPRDGFRSSGAAYIYGLSACRCRADLSGDGELDIYDFLAFQELFAAGDMKADFDGDGALTFFDFLAFQDEFAAGCP